MHDDAHKLTSFDDKGNSPLQVAELLYQKYTLSRYLSGDFRRYVVRNGKVSIRHRRAELTDDSTASDADPTELREVDAEWEAVEERLIQVSP